MSAKSLAELLNVPDPAWPLVQDWIRAARCRVEVLPPTPGKRERALEAAQVTVRSPMGAIVYETGGLLIDHGYLRVLGSGHAKFSRTLPEWNASRADGFFLIADDVVGGFFAIDGGAFGTKEGTIHYFAPDTLRWEPLDGMSYSQFLQWALSGKLAKFYESMRWHGWQQECEKVSGDEAFSIWPPLWAKEGKDIAKSSRRPVPVAEAYELNVIEFPRQLDKGKP